MPDIYVSPHHSKAKKTARTKKSSVKKQQKTTPFLTQMFSSFLARPLGVRFETQDIEEDVILLLRRHFATNIPWIATILILIILPAIILPILFGSNIFPEIISMSSLFILLLIWYEGIFGFFLMNFLNWYFNIYIVTNQRVVDIDFVGLLYREFSSAHLNRIEDVTFKQGGFFSSFFNYGDVLIQTAGAEPNFEFAAVAQPDKLVRQLGQLIRENVKKK